MILGPGDPVNIKRSYQRPKVRWSLGDILNDEKETIGPLTLSWLREPHKKVALDRRLENYFRSFTWPESLVLLQKQKQKYKIGMYSGVLLILSINHKGNATREWCLSAGERIAAPWSSRSIKRRYQDVKWCLGLKAIIELHYPVNRSSKTRAAH
jgi:hypothetical protein